MEGIGFVRWKLNTTKQFEREFKKLDRSTQRLISGWIEKNLLSCENPRAKGKGLKSNRVGQWRYRIGSYRLICTIEEDVLLITALSVGHRKYIYDD